MQRADSTPEPPPPWMPVAAAVAVHVLEVFPFGAQPEKKRPFPAYGQPEQIPPLPAVSKAARFVWSLSQLREQIYHPLLQRICVLGGEAIKLL